MSQQGEARQMTRCKHCGSTSFCKWQSPPDVIDALPPCCLDAEDMALLEKYEGRIAFAKIFIAIGIGIVIGLLWLGLRLVH
jgi:hypothetical protein